MHDQLSEVTAWIREFTPRLYSVALAFARDADDAEDLLQEMWVRAHQKASQRASSMPAGPWLHAILVSIGRSRWRRRTRRERLLALWYGKRDEPSAGFAPDIDQALRHARLWQAIAALPRLQRTVLLLRIVDDLSTADVAERLGLAEGTIKASLHRSLRALKQELSRDNALARPSTNPLPWTNP